MEIELEISNVEVRAREVSGAIVLKDLNDREMVIIQEYDIPALVEFLSRFL